MKNITIKGTSSEILFNAIVAQFIYLGYEVYSETQTFKTSIAKYSSSRFKFDDLKQIVGRGSFERPTHTYEEFFNLKPEDCQEYTPKRHKVTASKIKSILGVDARDEIILEDEG